MGAVRRDGAISIRRTFEVQLWRGVNAGRFPSRQQRSGSHIAGASLRRIKVGQKSLLTVSGRSSIWVSTRNR